MLAAKFDKQSSEVLGVKIFKNKEESLNFIKKELKNELKKIILRFSLVMKI